MSVWSNSAEGGSSGTAVTAANSGGGSGNAFYSVTTGTGTGTSVTYSTSAAAHGNLGYALTHVSGSGVSVTTLHYATDAVATFAARFYVNFSVVPTTATAIATVYDTNSTGPVQLIINGSGKLYIQGQGGVIGTMPTALSANTWYRVEIQGSLGATTTNGTINCDYYVLDTTTSLGNINSTAADFGTSAVVSFMSIGKMNASSTYAGVMSLDDIVFADATTTPIGPYTAPATPLVASAGSDRSNLEPFTTIVLSGSSSGGSGTIASYQWTQIAGSPAVTLAGATTAVASYTAPGTLAGTTLTFGYQVTNSSGTQSTQSTVQNVVMPVTERAALGGVEVPVQTQTVQNGAAVLAEIWTAESGQLVRRSGVADAVIPAAYSDSNPPWQLQAGETVEDNMPSGVTVIDYSDYATAGSFGQVMAAIRAAQTQPYYVQLPAGTFHITDFSFGATSGTRGSGYQDVSSTKLWGGLIGAGADQTFIVVDPNGMNSSQLAAVAAGNPSPVQMAALYCSAGNNIGIPTFISGITFQGNLQQATTINGYSGTTPAPYNGLAMSYAVAGSVVQYCCFQGFGFAATQSPPYETPAVGSTHSTWTLRRCEIDGRIASSIDPTQPVASGGLMWNYETNVAAVDSWLHHTRRSGWAMHDHAPTEGGNATDMGQYAGSNFQVNDISDTVDGNAGSALGFSCSNVEELRQSFTYTQTRFTTNTTDGSQHITIATSSGNSMPNGITIADPVIENTAYNGCLVVRIVKQPNSLGVSPWYTLYQSSGLTALPITVTNNGVALTPVLSTSFDSVANTPLSNYIVIVS